MDALTSYNIDRTEHWVQTKKLKLFYQLHFKDSSMLIIQEF